ncbi:hypothetical protein [Arthrobacter sp. AQ5-05]|uniref:hypothetical protein n=1 Tax=Arthrobacter sp. AQ5-05 TaxID=2184581 RepID=UPI0011BD6DC7|nr:hypothetical protein [Arthrobacter sp. AQ5-05]
MKHRPAEQTPAPSPTPTPTPNDAEIPHAIRRLPPLWFWLSVGAAVLAVAGSITGLLVPARIYGKETATLFDAGIAQDLVNLFLVAPLTVVLAVLAVRGSSKAQLCLLGLLVFTAYNYAIYTFSIHFGPLFLLWVAVLGLAVFASAGTVATLNTTELKAMFARTPVRLPGWFLMVTAVLFALLWLSEIVPDLLAGRPSTSAASWNIPTSPVHVLDLAVLLPGVFATGLALLRRDWLGYATAAGALIFLGLTSLPILLTPFVAQAHGREPVWTIMAPMGIIILAVLVILWLWLRPGRMNPSAVSDDFS